jgi:hypothetical protein
MPAVLVAEVKIILIAVISIVPVISIVSMVAVISMVAVVVMVVVSGISTLLCLRDSGADCGGKNRHHDQPGKSTYH